MKFAGRLRQQVLSDVVTVPDPWGMGVILGIRRRDSNVHQAWLRKKQRDNPMMTTMLTSVAQAALHRAATRGRTVDPSESERLITNQVEKLTLGPADLDQFFRADLEEAVALLVSWAGEGINDPDTGLPNECSEENKRALLEDDAVIPIGRGLRSEGQLLGEALIDFIHEVASQQDSERQKFLVEAGKGSGDTSGGTSVPGPTIPSSDVA